jgi:hypothetical protein
MVRSGLLVIVMCAGCATTSSFAPAAADSEWSEWPLPTEAPPPPVASESRLAAKARSLVGLSTLKVVAPGLPDDCTGLVRAVYDDAGISLLEFGQRGDNGVTAMYRFAFERSALHTSRPAPGDLVFFRETYDRNRDGLENDGLTHVGVVEAVDDEGTVTFVHRSGKGVTRARLNVGSPLDRRLNDYLRPRKKKSPALLTGELFVTYASATRLGAR